MLMTVVNLLFAVSYFFVSSQDEYIVTVAELNNPNTVNVFLQLPMYLTITIGEVLFSITGLEFAYSQVSCGQVWGRVTVLWLGPTMPPSDPIGPGQHEIAVSGSVVADSGVRKHGGGDCGGISDICQPG